MVRIGMGLLVLGVLAGCGQASGPAASSASAGADSAEAAVSIPFREDGSLQFVRDGEVLTTIAIEIADNDSSRTRGMMQRTSFPDDSGMLFVFPDERPRSFWMANTPLALDIMFVDADSQIVNIERYTRPMSSQSVPSAGPAQYVVEVPAGFSDRHGLIATDRVRWEDTR